MKSRFAALLLLLPALAAAQPAATTAGAGARTLYRSGQFAQAAQLFAGEAARRPDDPAAQYNLGDALFRSNQLGPAVAAYLRAWRLDPRDRDIRYNLDFALRRSGDSLVPSSTPVGVWLAFHMLSLRETEGLQWIFWWAMLLLACAAALGEARRASPRSALVAAACLWLFFASWWGLLYAAEPSGLAVTIAPRTELRNAPSDDSTVGFTAPEGRRVSILKERGDWIEIGVLKEGVEGWVKKDSIERV